MTALTIYVISPILYSRTIGDDVFFMVVSIETNPPFMGNEITTKGNDKTDGCWRSSKGVSPPARFSCSPTHRLRRFERSDCGCKVVSLCVLRVVACKLPHLLYGAVFVARHILSDIRHGVPAAQLGAKGTYPICPILRRRYLAPLSLSRCCDSLNMWNGKGNVHILCQSIL